MNLKPIRFDHVGYAVGSIADSLSHLIAPMFQPCAVGPIIEDPLQKVRVCFVTLVDGTRLELIEPSTENSPIRHYLNSDRSGLYHTCFATETLDLHIALFLERGCVVVSAPMPAVAFNGNRIAFLYSQDMGLFEIVETGS